MCCGFCWHSTALGETDLDQPHQSSFGGDSNIRLAAKLAGPVKPRRDSVRFLSLISVRLIRTQSVRRRNHHPIHYRFY
jgi:hypothetical protein